MVTFTVSVETTLRPDQLVEEILDAGNWPGFTGWGPIPGIREARIPERTQDIVGTRIEVTNTDGSTHEETVIEYVPERRLVMRIDSFSGPLSRIADFFLETWEFERRGHETHVERIFTLYPNNLIGKILLRIVAYGLKKAVQTHTSAFAA